MDHMLENYLKTGAAEFGADLDDCMVRRFFDYKRILLEWNEKMNLTAIRDDREIILKHFTDSLSILPYIRGKRKLIDVGTGAGFPGIPLKIVLPQLETVLLDSLEKESDFSKQLSVNWSSMPSPQSTAELRMPESHRNTEKRMMWQWPGLLLHCPCFWNTASLS